MFDLRSIVTDGRLPLIRIRKIPIRGSFSDREMVKSPPNVSLAQSIGRSPRTCAATADSAVCSRRRRGEYAARRIETTRFERANLWRNCSGQFAFRICLARREFERLDVRCPLRADFGVMAIPPCQEESSEAT